MAARRLDETLTAFQLREMLFYEAVTGRFTWRPRVTGNGGWNTRYAGKEAGTPKLNAYIQIGINGRLYLAHRLAWLWMTKSWPVDEIDHIDGDPTNNAWKNLRAATSSQNKMNKRRRSDNTSGFKGVSLNRRDGTWNVEAGAGYQRIRLTGFATPEDAHVAYCKAIESLHGKFGKSG